MGNIAAAVQNYAAAKEHYQAAYALRQEFNDPEGMAVALNHLGQVALEQEDFAGGRQLFEQSRAIYQEIGDRGGLAAAFNGLGQTTVAEGDIQSARQSFQQALQIATEIQFMPLVLSILAAIADLLRQTGPAELRLDLLSLIAHHPASPPEIKAQAGHRLSADAPLPAADPTPLLTQVQSLLATPLTPFDPVAQATTATSIDQSSLIEPLTKRELEVLQLIAEGLTNQEIAERLSVVIGTVKAHNNSIYSKLAVRNRVEALAQAQALGLLS
jgi:ATP/maltotriose-dependent transcriptional regulator MalT